MGLVSIVVPLYNEVENVADLYYELTNVLVRANLNYEIVFVDDGSTDGTSQALLEAAQEDPAVVLVQFRRNFGQTAAMAAGFDYASGDAIVTMDGDLQNDPAEIPRMLAKLEEGYDMVAGWRKNRQDKALTRRLPSLIANFLISKTTKVQLHDYGCTLKVIRSDVAKKLNLYGEMHRFIPALAAELGVRIAEVPVNHRPRTRGTSKYGISRTFRVILDLLTVKFFLKFSTRPLHMFGVLSFVCAGLGMALGTYITYERLFLGVPLGTRPLFLLAAMLVLVGLQFICFGLLAEVLVRTYHESQDKKIYTVRNVFKTDRPVSTEPKMRRVIRRR